MTAHITPQKLCGEVEAIASKSDVHRILICAALADKPTEIILSGSMGADTLSEDIRATMNCLNALGADISALKSNDGKTSILVKPIDEVPENPKLDCGESGSTLRFILPVAAALLKDDNTITITGRGRLPDRPIGELKDVLEQGGVTFSAPKLPFTISGEFKAGTYEIAGNVSSQYITGLLLGLSAISKADDNTSHTTSKIRITSELQSAAYIDITTSAMAKFGVNVQRVCEDGLTCFKVSGVPMDSNKNGKHFTSPGKLYADGDWSNAAFFLALKNLGHDVLVSQLDTNSPQGDKAIVEMLKLLAENRSDNEVRTISLAEIPDLLPIMAVVAAFSSGTTHFVDGERLRIKESDRLASVCELITKLGGKAEEQPAGLIVYPQALTGGEIDSYNDHRIVMAAAIAAANCTSTVTITGAGAVNKSYPTFFEDYKRLGGTINVI